MAEIAHFTKTELREYEDSLKAYRDIKNSLDTAKEEGRAEGRAEGLEEGMNKARVQFARDLLKISMPVSEIIKLTKLTEEEINKLI